MASSGNYVSEPPTVGKVVLKTTVGEIHIEFWAKEAPHSVRNFLQLCLENYYSGCIFHRVIPGILIQTGDPTGSGVGGESVYGGGFLDEFHSRLKFNHRGLVAWANMRRNDNRSQFFITLDKTPWLDGRHCIFGKVTGSSIYTAVKLSECDVGKDDRPLEPPVLLSAEVTANPFSDIVPRSLLQAAVPVITPEPKSKPKVQVKTLLSFEEENEGGDTQIKSSHDVLTDPALLKETAPLLPPTSSVPAQIPKPAAFTYLPSAEEDTTEDQDFDKLMKKRVLEQREALAGVRSHSLMVETVEEGGYTIETEADKVRVTKPVEEDMDQELISLQATSHLRLKQHRTGTNNEVVQAAIQAEEQLLSPLERRRFQYRQQQRKTKGREEQTLAQLDQFLGRLGEHRKPPEELTQEEQELWFNNRLRFAVDSTTAFAFSKAEEDKRKKTTSQEEEDPTLRLRRLNEDADRYQTAELREMLSLDNLEKITNPQQD
jgi:peptidyl-prolyl cis-trans isomerase SDCCAG10